VYRNFNKLLEPELMALMAFLEINNLAHISLPQLSTKTWQRYLKKLVLPEAEIRDLAPLAYFTGLQHLDLGCNQITDLAPLASLKQLTYLNLIGNRIQNIEPLAGLNSLSCLFLDCNRISDLSPLANLANLKFLGLTGTEVKDLRPLKDLKNLNIEIKVKSFLVSVIFSFEVSIILGSRPSGIVEFRNEQEIFWYRIHPDKPKGYRLRPDKPKSKLYRGNPAIDLDKQIQDWLAKKSDFFAARFFDVGFRFPKPPDYDLFPFAKNGFRVSSCDGYDVFLIPKSFKEPNFIKFSNDDSSYICEVKFPNIFFDNAGKPSADLQKKFESWFNRNNMSMARCAGTLWGHEEPLPFIGE